MILNVEQLIFCSIIISVFILYYVFIHSSLSDLHKVDHKNNPKIKADIDKHTQQDDGFFGNCPIHVWSKCCHADTGVSCSPKQRLECGCPNALETVTWTCEKNTMRCEKVFDGTGKYAQKGECEEKSTCNAGRTAVCSVDVQPVDAVPNSTLPVATQTDINVTKACNDRYLLINGDIGVFPSESDCNRLFYRNDKNEKIKCDVRGHLAEDDDWDSWKFKCSKPYATTDDNNCPKLAKNKYCTYDIDCISGKCDTSDEMNSNKCL
jgi:hypothetical protein